LHEKGLSPDIFTFTSKEPVWSDKGQAYILDFKGKVTTASVKNFILVDQEKKNECIIFGKIKRDLYTLNILWPFSLYQGFGLAISSIASKIGCQ